MRISLIISLFLLTISLQAKADVNVVTSIKPVHSLVAAVMKGTRPPYLIVKANHSPHSYNMKPSDARALKQADIIFWVGSGLETFLQKPIRSLGNQAKHVELIKTHGLDVLNFREGKDWQHHQHNAQDHNHNSKNNLDVHIWLSPKNAERIVEQVVRYLVEKDPKRADLYKKNAYETLQKLKKLDEDLKAELTSYSKISFIVFHDSYQYFEKHYNLKAAGSITINPDVQIGAKHLLDLKTQISTAGIKCIFSEPQFSSKIVTSLSRSTKMRIAVLDPLGSELDIGPELYFQMMRNNAKAISACLKP